MIRREDTYTNTEADAGRYDADVFGDLYPDDTPTLAELMADENEAHWRERWEATR